MIFLKQPWGRHFFSLHFLNLKLAVKKKKKRIQGPKENICTFSIIIVLSWRTSPVYSLVRRSWTHIERVGQGIIWFFSSGDLNAARRSLVFVSEPFFAVSEVSPHSIQISSGNARNTKTKECKKLSGKRKNNNILVGFSWDLLNAE